MSQKVGFWEYTRRSAKAATHEYFAPFAQQKAINVQQKVMNVKMAERKDDAVPSAIPNEKPQANKLPKRWVVETAENGPHVRGKSEVIGTIRLSDGQIGYVVTTTPQGSGVVGKSMERKFRAAGVGVTGDSLLGQFVIEE